MKKMSFSAKGMMVLGFVLFTFGLLLILRESNLYGFFTSVIADAQITLVFGTVVLFAGQMLVVFGAVKANSIKLLSSMQTERKETLNLFALSIDQFQSRMQNERQAIMASYNQTMSKLDSFIGAQKLANTTQQTVLPSNCRFCGTKIAQSPFCPNCGKAN